MLPFPMPAAPLALLRGRHDRVARDARRAASIPPAFGPLYLARRAAIP